ncbi:MAG: prolyl oligopeptidase family serine peptidase [Limisphaerales bacterium]
MIPILHRGAMLTLAAGWLAVLPLQGDGPADNRSDNVRPIPPPGVAIAAGDRVELSARAAVLAAELDALESALTNQPALLARLPDVRVPHKAVDWALRYDEFYDATNEVTAARGLLALAEERAAQLRAGRSPWIAATGLVVRAYRSRIDGSVQPYGLVVPASYQPNSPHRWRLDVWFHGRGEKLTELNFIRERLGSPGEFTPPDTIVLHPYGRYCNANKFAGEVDLFEALEDVQRTHRIDPDRIFVRGFSMGGAACWQFAVHYADRWAGAAPGAGFAETREFLRIFQHEAVTPPPWEQKLWHWYDAPDYAANLFHCPVVAYSGEQDKQRQAADVMAAALATEGMNLMHLVGPGMGHRYDAASKAEIERRLADIARRGRDPWPRRVRFTTWTLRYDRMHWVRVDGLAEHWKRARVGAEVTGPRTVVIQTENVAALTVDMPAGSPLLEPSGLTSFEIDGEPLNAAAVRSDRSVRASFVRRDGAWRLADGGAEGLAKRHGLQGPIDDAFMDRFIFVRPTGVSTHQAADAWARAEMERAISEWRRQFRGDVIVRDDMAVTEADARDAHLVAWGDPESNRWLARHAERLPVRWADGCIALGRHVLPADNHLVALIHPNPANPTRYLVQNSGFTYRPYDYLNNARQTAKLPDWALLSLAEPGKHHRPAVVAAGFFGEQWETIGSDR